MLTGVIGGFLGSKSKRMIEIQSTNSGGSLEPAFLEKNICWWNAGLPSQSCDRRSAPGWEGRTYSGHGSLVDGLALSPV